MFWPNYLPRTCWPTRISRASSPTPAISALKRLSAIRSPWLLRTWQLWFFGTFNRKRSSLQILRKKNQVATPICYDQFANAEEIEKLGELCIPEQNAFWTKNLHQELVGLSTSPTSQGQRYQNFLTRWTQHLPLNTNFRLWTSPSLFLSRQVLHDPQYKAKAKQVGAALSPWKEMVGPVDRSFQSIGVI